MNYKLRVRNYELDSFAILLLLLIGVSCGPKDEAWGDTDKADSEIAADTTHVTATILALSAFDQEVLSQGQIMTKEKVDVSLPSSGIIKSINIRRGQRVSKGQTLAMLDANKWQQELDLLLAEMAEKKLQLESKLLSLGYDTTSTIPKDLLTKVKIELGIPTLQKRISHKNTELSEKSITAPISGLIADLEAQPGNPTTNFKKLCTIINDRRLEVKFPILESEISHIKKGRSVTIAPFYDDQTSQAKITSYDPLVDEDGLIWVYADITQSNSQLLDGMKVNVSAKKSIPGQRVLPKSAVLDRQDRYVIFTYKNGMAHWVYGHIDQENSTHYTLKDEGPQVGDTVIISNNFNLAHLEPVVVDSIRN